MNFLCPVCHRENRAENKECTCGTPLGILGSRGKRCPICGWNRIPNAKFCGDFGHPLPPLCDNCGFDISKDSRYCPRCGFLTNGGRIKN